MPIKHSSISDHSETMFVVVENGQSLALIVTSEPTSPLIVSRAWSYALDQRPKTLNVPDYPAALKLMQERHPSWTVFGSGKEYFSRITYNEGEIDKDVPEETSNSGEYSLHHYKNLWLIYDQMKKEYVFAIFKTQAEAQAELARLKAQRS